MGTLTGELHKAHKYHVQELAEHGTPQDGEGDFSAHPAGVIAHHQT